MSYFSTLITVIVTESENGHLGYKKMVLIFFPCDMVSDSKTKTTALLML